jgi:hypothetical protein
VDVVEAGVEGTVTGGMAVKLGARIKSCNGRLHSKGGMKRPEEKQISDEMRRKLFRTIRKMNTWLFTIYPRLAHRLFAELFTKSALSAIL